MSLPYNRGPIPGQLPDLPVYLRKELDKIIQSIASRVSGDATMLADIVALQAGTSVVPVKWTYTPVAALARGSWTLSASATSGSYPKSNAVDADATTRWSTGAVVTPNTSYFGIDLGSAGMVGAVVVDNTSFTGDVPAAGNIQWSDDDSAWTTIATWTLAANFANGLLTQSWTPASHRYWRLLATATPTTGTNWWSIGEINLSASTLPTSIRYEVANVTWTTGVSKAVTLSGQFTKAAVTDYLSIGIGPDVNNCYALEVGSSQAYVNLVKIVAGVRTQLLDAGFDSDTNPHYFELMIGLPATGGAANWITLRTGRANNPPTTQGTTDTALDLTTGTGNFLLKATGPTTVRGASYSVT